jgi:beta-lactamase class A
MQLRTAIGYPQTSQRVGLVIQNIRIEQFNAETTRMVVTLAPGYTFDLAQVKLQEESPNHWSVQLPKPLPLTATQPKYLEITPSISPTVSDNSTLFAGVVPMHSPMKALEPQIKALMSRYSFLKTGMFFLDLDTGDYLDIGGDRVFPAASTIKLPILIAFFQDLDAGKVTLQEILTMRRDLVTNGSGIMQYERVGKKYTALETITKMITMPNGKRYLAAIFVTRPYKDTRGRDFIRQVSQLVYNYLNQPNPVAAVDSPYGVTR